MRLLILLMALAIPPSLQIASSAAEEQHIAEVIKSLPPNSALRLDLVRGARGDGVRRAWMESMRRQNIKRAVVRVDILFDGKGRAKELGIGKIMYFECYEDCTPISENERIESIRRSGLESELSSLGLQRAKQGSWVDVPRPRARPFTGGATIEFLDDEWLPASDSPLYFATKR